MLIFLYFRFKRESQLKVSQKSPRMSMMDPNLLDAATFGGPQSPLDIKPEAGSLLTTVTTAIQSPGSASTSVLGRVDHSHWSRSIQIEILCSEWCCYASSLMP